MGIGWSGSSGSAPNNFSVDNLDMSLSALSDAQKVQVLLRENERLRLEIIKVNSVQSGKEHEGTRFGSDARTQKEIRKSETMKRLQAFKADATSNTMTVTCGDAFDRHIVHQCALQVGRQMNGYI